REPCERGECSAETSLIPSAPANRPAPVRFRQDQSPYAPPSGWEKLQPPVVAPPRSRRRNKDARSRSPSEKKASPLRRFHPTTRRGQSIPAISPGPEKNLCSTPARLFSPAGSRRRPRRQCGPESWFLNSHSTPASVGRSFRSDCAACFPSSGTLSATYTL